MSIDLGTIVLACLLAGVFWKFGELIVDFIWSIAKVFIEDIKERKRDHRE